MARMVSADESARAKYDDPRILGKDWVQLSGERPNILSCSERSSNSSSPGVCRNLGKRLSDSQSIGEEEESEMGMAERKILSGQILEQNQRT